MAEWLVEAGIGEDRAALIEAGAIVEARIARHDGGLTLGAILSVRLRRRHGPNGRGEVETADGACALLAPVPAGLTEGAALTVEVVREAIPERGNPKLALVRASDEPVRPALALAAQLSGAPVTILALHQPDRLEAAGWSELIEQAETGLVPFPGGLLRIALTSAMTVIDVDGDLDPAELARRGAASAGAAIRRFDIGGSIGIDLPTVASRAERQAAAEALDAALPQPFERTAVNGFGFVQVIRRRLRPSLLELFQADPVEAAAIALLRRAERDPSHRAHLDGSSAVLARLRQRPDWLDELARRRGRAVALDP